MLWRDFRGDQCLRCLEELISGNLESVGKSYVEDADGYLGGWDRVLPDKSQMGFECESGVRDDAVVDMYIL